MVENTNIEWCDHTINFWIGCQKVAPECDFCYAERDNNRFKLAKEGWGPKTPRHRTSKAKWNEPRKWNRQADAFFAEHGRRQRVFPNSWSDVFDNAIDPVWRADMWDVIRECDKLDWLLLTKRPQNIVKMLPEDWRGGWDHVWLGTSAGCQESADKNIPPLLDAPAAKRFLSCEPMLGPVVLVDRDPIKLATGVPAKPEHRVYVSLLRGWGIGKYARPGLDWVICGGESGPNARPMHPDWARSLRDQCEMADVPFLFKQWGEWAPGIFECDSGSEFYDGPTLYCDADDSDAETSKYEGHVFHPETGQPLEFWTNLPDYALDGRKITACRKVGKKAAGRLLDGVTHDRFPVSPAGAQ